MNVEIYTLDYCPHCKKALGFLNERKVEYTQTRVDDDINGWSEKLGTKYGIKPHSVTFPQIIVDGVLIGGNSDMEELNAKGKLPF